MAVDFEDARHGPKPEGKDQTEAIVSLHRRQQRREWLRHCYRCSRERLRHRSHNLDWGDFSSGYNIWYVTRKEDIALARQTSSPPAVPVAGCAAPAPAAGLTCTDIGAVSRDPSLPFFYQARAFCDATTEAP